MQTIPLSPKFFAGAVSFEEGSGWIKPWRIPFQERSLFHPPDQIQNRAERAAGVRLRFQTDASSLTLLVEPDEEERLFDLVLNNEPKITLKLAPGETAAIFQDLPASDGIYEIWLSQFGRVAARSFEIPAGAQLEPAPDHRTKWVTYGSSITQCRTAFSPCRTWPGIAARKLDLNLQCLGYGGNCMLETMIGRMIRDLPADIITLKLGINVHGSSSLNHRTYQPAVVGLIQLIRERHMSAPIGVITSIASPPREDHANQAGMRLEDYRHQTREAVDRLRELGDERLFLFEGTTLLSEAEERLLPDGLHPNAEGYQLMGERVAEKILPKLLASR